MQTNTHLVAVYGTLKRAYGNHRVMEQAGGVYLTTTETEKPLLMGDGGFPMIFEPTEELQRFAVPCQVEVFRVRDLEPLDLLEGHPNFYHREQIQVVHFKEPVWLYLGPPLSDLQSIPRNFLSSGHWDPRKIEEPIRDPRTVQERNGGEEESEGEYEEETLKGGRVARL